MNSSINFSTWHLGIFLLGPAVSSVSGLVFFITFAFLLLIQFFRKILNLEIIHPTFNKMYIGVILFYCVMNFFNFIFLLNWPNEEHLNLIKFPPDNFGSGIIKISFLSDSLCYFAFTVNCNFVYFLAEGKFLFWLFVPLVLFTFSYITFFADYVFIYWWI